MLRSLLFDQNFLSLSSSLVFFSLCSGVYLSGGIVLVRLSLARLVQSILGASPSICVLGPAFPPFAFTSPVKFSFPPVDFFTRLSVAPPFLHPAHPDSSPSFSPSPQVDTRLAKPSALRIGVPSSQLGPLPLMWVFFSLPSRSPSLRVPPLPLDSYYCLQLFSDRALSALG